MIDIFDTLTADERAALTLRGIYRDAGYGHYKMSKFEEYDLYVRNKDFLVSDNIITFTDTDGRLLALKPDVTLSIINSSRDSSGVMKVYYDENVYRVSRGTHSFKEIKQVGLECIGEISESEIAEVITLAGRSLDAISNRSVLDVSHLDVAAGLFSHFGITGKLAVEASVALGQKNEGRLSEICDECGACDFGRELICSLVYLSSDAKSVAPMLEKYRVNEQISSSIDSLLRVLSKVDFDRVNVDFSVIGNMRYYNGFAIKGFVEGIPVGVLSGGQYDTLMKKMHRSEGAIGFAVYLDEIERLPGGVCKK
jgi:ATP phosphoribosyltransferase regulatory subunit